MDDISNLMALYTEAVEFYNCTAKSEKQKYYESKLTKLVKSPDIMKIYDQGNTIGDKKEPEIDQ